MPFFKPLLCRIWQAGSRMADLLFYHGCDFGTWMDQEEAGFCQEQGNKYQPCNGALNRVIRDLKIRPQDRILDIGCGKGRAMAIMRRYPFEEVAGIDLSLKLVEIANLNFRRLGLDNCAACQADAAEYEDWDRFNYFYLFNSLPEPVFRRAMARLCASLRRHPRRCVLIYLNPVCHLFLTKQTPFRLVRTYASWCSWFEYRVYEANLSDPG